MNSLRIALLTVFVPLLAGCIFSNKPKRIPAPKWKPDASADQAMSEYDSDGDGFLSSKELAAAPGLRAASSEMDVDKDKKLSRDEIVDRIKEYAENRTGLMEFRCLVKYKNRPLPNAKILLVPEPFLGDVVSGAEGETAQDGTAKLGKLDSLELYVMPGIYRVEITSDNVSLPAKYNTATTLGVEVAPFTKQGQTGVETFNLK